MIVRPAAVRFALRLAAGPVLAAIVALAMSAAGCRQRGTPDPAIRMAVSHEPDETAAQPSTSSTSASASESAPQSQPGADAGKVPVPTRLEVPPAVQEAFSGVRLSWKDSSNGKSGTIEVPLGGATPIPDSPLQVRADVYLPAFTMSADAITSTGVGEENPAARIAVQENGKDLFAGWIFNRFPDVHPFQHPRFSLKLEGGIARAPKKK